MTRRRYVYDPKTKEMVEITQGAQPEARADAGALWGDRHYDGMRATDGTDISSRTKHREYMKANNLTTADDFTNSWAKAREQRDRLFTQGGSFTRNDIERAMHQLQSRK